MGSPRSPSPGSRCWRVSCFPGRAKPPPTGRSPEHAGGSQAGVAGPSVTAGWGGGSSHPRAPPRGCRWWCFSPPSDPFIGVCGQTVPREAITTIFTIVLPRNRLQEVPVGPGDSWGQLGPHLDINALESPREEGNAETGPNRPQPSPNGINPAPRTPLGSPHPGCGNRVPQRRQDAVPPAPPSPGTVATGVGG